MIQYIYTVHCGFNFDLVCFGTSAHLFSNYKINLFHGFHFPHPLSFHWDMNLKGSLDIFAQSYTCLLNGILSAKPFYVQLHVLVLFHRVISSLFNCGSQSKQLVSWKEGPEFLFGPKLLHCIVIFFLHYLMCGKNH